MKNTTHSPYPPVETARELDAADELRHFRQQFTGAGNGESSDGVIYLDGNSLGRMPAAAPALVEDLVQRQWGRRLIRGWNEGWFEAPRRLGGRLAELVGAQPTEVVVGDSTSVNLFKLAVAALRARPGRRKIVTDTFNFPSDLYILQGVIDLLGGGRRLELVGSRDDLTIHPEDLAAAVDDDTALVTLSHVAFKSAYLYDMQAVTGLAHRHGALALWDLSHSVGAVPVELTACDADLAIGCTYKYLNGGPGSPAFLYVRKDLQAELVPPIWGWFGDRSPFEFGLDYHPAEDIRRFQVSTPPVLSTLALEPGLDGLLEAGMARLRAKSIRQTEYLIELYDEWLEPLGFRLGAPRDPAIRGSHVCVRHAEGYRITRALIEPANPADPAVIPDFRAPDNIRLGIAPIYTSFEDIRRCVQRMIEIVSRREYERFSAQRLAVT